MRPFKPFCGLGIKYIRIQLCYLYFYGIVELFDPRYFICICVIETAGLRESLAVDLLNGGDNLCIPYSMENSLI
jgi:hypothetical protein